MSEILVRYGELALKSPPVRRMMEKHLVRNISLLMEKNGILDSEYTVNRTWGRINIILHPTKKSQEISADEIAKKVAENVYGIVSTSPTIKVGLQEMEAKLLEIADKNLTENSTFAVRVKRTGTHDFTSKDKERELGAAIYIAYNKTRNISVNLTNPDYLFQIEIKDKNAFLFESRFSGYGGLPQGTQGTIVSIFRGSLEDSLAAFLLCKRGTLTLPILFEIDDKTLDYSNKKALKQQLEYYKFVQPKKHLKYISVNFEHILEKIGPDRITCSRCDKACLLVTEKIITKQRKQGITLGNSSDAITTRELTTKLITEIVPIYYPLLAIDLKTVKHPFADGFKGEFCLENCPGYLNQQKKEIKPLTEDELSEIVASTDYYLISPDKT